MVVSHDTPMWRTIDQRTCRPRRRPTPAPTIDDASTSVVLTGRAHERRGHARPRPSCPARPARRAGRMRTMRRPSVRTIDQPAEGRAEGERRRGRERDPQRHRRRRPGGRTATSTATIAPIDFWASLAPWPNASAPAETHSPAPTAGSTRRVARRRRPSGQAVGDGAEHQAEGDREEQGEDRAEHTRRPPVRHPAPVDGVGPAGRQRRAGQPADEGLAGAGRDAPPPAERRTTPPRR